MTDVGEARFARVITTAFLVVSLAKTLTHEPWRDEWSPWGVALASPDVAQFWEALRYGGHARLWHLLVFALERATGAFETVQVLAAVLATLSVWAVARFSPFPRWARVLFALGYYPLFEYGSIARPYAIALPASCLAAGLFARARRDPLPLAVALAVLAQTTVFGVILAAAFGAAWLVDRSAAPVAGRAPGLRVGVAAGLLGASMAAAVLQMVPPHDSSFAPGWHLGFEQQRLSWVLGTVARGVAPLPIPRLHFWNTHLLDGHAQIATVAGAGVLVAFSLLFAGRLPALALWIVAASGQLAFQYIKHLGDARHHGHLFLAFLAASWIATETAGAGGPRSLVVRLRSIALGAVLTLNAVAGLFATAMDVTLPFSTAKATAAAIRARGLVDLPILGDRASTSAAVAAALGRPFVLAGTGRVSTFVRWDASYRVASPQLVVSELVRLAAQTRSPVLLVRDRPLIPLPPGIEEVARMEEAVVRDERFSVYLVGHLAQPR